MSVDVLMTVQKYVTKRAYIWSSFNLHNLLSNARAHIILLLALKSSAHFKWPRSLLCTYQQCKTLFLSNAEICPMHFDHFSQNLLTLTMNKFELKCIWKLMTFLYQWCIIMEDETIFTFYRNIKNQKSYNFLIVCDICFAL